MSNCFCHFGGYEVKDKVAREQIAEMLQTVADCEATVDGMVAEVSANTAAIERLEEEVQNIPGGETVNLNFEAHLNSYTNTEGTTHKTPAMTFTDDDKEYVLVRSKQQVSSNAVVLSLTVDRTGNRLVVTTYHETDGFGTYYVPFSS